MPPSPPTDIGSYSRFMHQHTKRQMDAANRSSQRRSDHQSTRSGFTPAMPNGVSSMSSYSPEDHVYHS